MDVAANYGVGLLPSNHVLQEKNFAYCKTWQSNPASNLVSLHLTLITSDMGIYG